MDLGAGILGSFTTELHLPEMFPFHAEKINSRKDFRDIAKGVKFTSMNRVIFQRCKMSLSLVF